MKRIFLSLLIPTVSLANLITVALFIPTVSLAGLITVTPTDQTQKELQNTYKLAIDRSQNSWVENGAVNSEVSARFGEVPVYWSASADRGSFLFFQPFNDLQYGLTRANWNQYKNIGYQQKDLSYSSTFPKAYSFSFSDKTISILKSNIKDAFGLTVSWEYYYIKDRLENDLGLATEIISETDIANNKLSGKKLLIIPAFEVSGTNNGRFIERSVAENPGFSQKLVNFVNSGGTIYTEGNAAYLLEVCGIIPAGSIDLIDTIDGRQENNMLAELTIIDPSNPLGFPMTQTTLYTVQSPKINLTQGVVAKYNGSNTPAIVVIENSGKIIINASLPSAGAKIIQGNNQWQWVANAVIFAYCNRVDVVRSVYTNIASLPYGGAVDDNDLPADADVPFEVTVRVRNLWDTSAGDVTVKETYKTYFDYTKVISVPSPSISGNALSFSIGNLSGQTESIIKYQLYTPKKDDLRTKNINSYLDSTDQMRVSSCNFSFSCPKTQNKIYASRNSLWTRFLFSARLVADTDLNWKNILGEFFQPFKIFCTVENKERTQAVNAIYTQYIPKDVPIYWISGSATPVVKTPGGIFVDLLKGSDDKNSVQYDMDKDGDPDAWLDLATFHPRYDGYPIQPETKHIAWLNPWNFQFEDIDKDGEVCTALRAADGKDFSYGGDGRPIYDNIQFTHIDFGDLIRAWKVTWNMGVVPGYQFYDPYSSWELWIDPPPLIPMAVGAVQATNPDRDTDNDGFKDCDLNKDGILNDTYYYENWARWMTKDAQGDVVCKRLITQKIDSYEGFAFVDGSYQLKPGERDHGLVPYPNASYDAILNFGGEEVRMGTPTPDFSPYSYIEYKTAWDQYKITPIRTTYTYYAPLPNPLQFEYLSKTFEIKQNGKVVDSLPAYGEADITFKITGSTEYSLYWIKLVGTDVGDGIDPDGTGDGVFGYLVENIPKGLGGYKIDLPRKADGSVDFQKLCPDYKVWIQKINNLGPRYKDIETDIQIIDNPFYWSIYIPQVLIPPALDDDNNDSIDDWLDDKGDRFKSATGYMSDSFPAMTGAEVEALDWVSDSDANSVGEGDMAEHHKGWYKGADGTYGDDLVEELGRVTFTINVKFKNNGREGSLKINDGAWLVNEEIFGGSPWVQFSHTQHAFAIGSVIWLNGWVDPSLIKLDPSSVYFKHRIKEMPYSNGVGEPHPFDLLFDPWIRSAGFLDVQVTSYLGGKDPCSLLSPDINMPAIVDPDDETEVVICPRHPTMKKTERGAFIEARIEVNNNTNKEWRNVKVTPKLVGLGNSDVVFCYSVYPRPLVPAHIGPNGEVIGGDDPGTFRMGWRFNPSSLEVLMEPGNYEGDGSAEIPQILASRRAYYIFLIKVDKTLPKEKVYEINFEMTGYEKDYKQGGLGFPLPTYAVPEVRFSLADKDSNGKVIGGRYGKFIIGQADLTSLTDGLKDYTAFNDAKWNPTLPSWAGLSDIQKEASFNSFNPLSVTGDKQLSYSVPQEYKTFPPEPDKTELWILTKTTVDPPTSDENIPLDTMMKLFYTDERGVAGQSWAWTDNVEPYRVLKVTARGAILVLKQRVSNVNGKEVGENGHYLLQDGTNTVIISLLAYNEGNDIGYNTVLSTKLDLNVDLVCIGTNDFYTYNEQTGVISWEPAHILPGARRKIPITVCIYKPPEETNEMNVATGFCALFADKEEGGEIKMEEAPKEENVSYVPGFDLVPGDISISNLSISEGDVVVITSKVNLTGGKEAKNVRVRDFDSGRRIGTDLETGYILTGSSLVVSKTWNTTGCAGVRTLSCAIDPDNEFDEENEQNNVATMTVTVYPVQTGSIATTLSLAEPKSLRHTLFANEPITFSCDFRRADTYEPIGRIVWKKDLSDNLYSLALADIDSNGKENEIICAGKNAGYIYDNKGNRLWKAALENGFCQAEAMDSDSDGFLNEVALLSIDRGLYLFDKEGNFIFSKDTAKLGGSPCLAIKACDTQPDLWLSNEIACLVKGKLSVWTGTGTKLWDAAVSPLATKIAIGDVDRNGMMDNLICGDKAFDRQGNLIRTYPVVGGSVAAGDLNADGFSNEVVMANQSLSAFNGTGTQMWTRFSGGDLINDLLVINLDSDTKNDVVCEKDNILYAIKNSGTTTQILWQYPTGNITSISAGDIDLDGVDEIVACGDFLYAFEKNGSLTCKFQASTSTTKLTDINSDGAADMLCTSLGLLTIFQESAADIKFDNGEWQGMTWDDELRLWKATQSFVKPGTHTYQVKCGKGGYISSTGQSNFYLSQIANVILRKKASSKAILEQGTITYTIEYENTGEGTATDVTIIEVLPEKTELSIVNSPQAIVNYWYGNKWQPAFNPSATKLKWLIHSVPPSQLDSVSFTVKVK